MTGPFLILHGLEGSGPDHWQTWLAGRLRARGEEVAYPDLPDPFDPQPDAWETTLKEVLTGDQVVLCHSLACLLWLRAAAAGWAAAERVLLVAPPYRPDIGPVDRFLAHRATAGDVERALVVCSDNDPYCPEGALELYAKPLEMPAHLLPGAGHINTDAGYGEWPDVEAWALGEARFPALYSP